ncbi:MAG: peptidoglycan editing factor PgeF [Pseudoflavonifractor sp.]|nr:peptidoglycan editing factor PgeF [Pseudoflavonifractor sp.]
MTSATDCSDFYVPLLDSCGIRAFTTTRGDCIGDDPYSRFSLCHYTGDTELHIAACRSMLGDRLDVPRERIIVPRQTHSANVAEISSYSQPSPDDTDALVTTLPGIVIGVNTADCVPLLMYDAKARVIAAAHAGWRGTVARIAALTVKVMESLGATARDIKVLQGPSICRECFEVGDEVVARFAEAGFPLDRICSRNLSTGRPHIDLREANTLILEAVGVRRVNIAPAVGCSHCNPRRYFSARRLGSASGRTFTGIMLL